MPEQSSSFDENGNVYNNWTFDEKISFISWYHKNQNHVRGEELRHKVNSIFEGFNCSRYMVELVKNACEECETMESFKAMKI